MLVDSKKADTMKMSAITMLAVYNVWYCQEATHKANRAEWETGERILPLNHLPGYWLYY